MNSRTHHYVYIRISWLLFALLGVCPYAKASLLESIPLLGQKDPANYRDEDFPTLPDTIMSGSDKTEEVQNLACAAAVYTMIERGLGNKDAMIDDIYEDPRPENSFHSGAMPPSYLRSNAVALDWDVVREQLKSGLPVVIIGQGGKSTQHYALVVASNNDAKRVKVFDPYPKGSGLVAGQSYYLDTTIAPITHPYLSEIRFGLMKVINSSLLPELTPIEKPNKPAVTPKLPTAPEPMPAKGTKFSQDYAKRIIEYEWNRSALKVPLGDIKVAHGYKSQADPSQGFYTAKQFNHIKAFQQVGLINIREKIDRTKNFTGWNDWFKLTQQGHALEVAISLTSRGRQHNTSSSYSHAAFPEGRYQIEEIISVKELKRNFDTFKLIRGFHRAEYPDYAQELYKLWGETKESSEARKFEGLFKYNEFEERWDLVACDVSEREKDFTTGNVQKTLGDER